jgi:hypothetical protein
MMSIVTTMRGENNETLDDHVRCCFDSGTLWQWAVLVSSLD